ncbi:phage replisome organizer N-terminal domain-containing protein [Streptococcus sp. O1]|uniref:phage replisome organizer N-terminal domain-containing protein n=1 Tax=Streptococcus sp. O1 TaxID=2928735 RepID=UPI00277D1076|nr:phage replisome organizer N-terminal domain-containing protein [Streptococcus sp. O1]
MATDIKWIKITTDIFDDEKILLIESLPESETIIVIWFKLLALAGKQNYSGVLMMNDRVHYTDEMLATIFRRPLNTIKLALSTFERFEMIEIVNGAITIPNWEKHQSVDQMDKVREQGRIRTARHRKKQKCWRMVTLHVTLQ